MSEQLRLYTFINFYLSQIQQGIQTAHIVHELFNKYRFQFSDGRPNSSSLDSLNDWSLNHKTIIVLNGGEDRAIEEIWLAANKLNEAEDKYPIASFNEDAGLGNVRTGFGIILPERLFSAKFVITEGVESFFESALDYRDNGGSLMYNAYRDMHPEFEFLQLLKQKRLA